MVVAGDGRLRVDEAFGSLEQRHAYTTIGRPLVGAGRLSANIGMWFDWAIQRLIPSFVRTVIGALAEDATPEEVKFATISWQFDLC